MSDKHKQLQQLAITWLYERGCGIFGKEIPTRNGNADALGIKVVNGDKSGDVYYIECKASRSDLICLKQRACYLRSDGHGMERCYIHNWKGVDEEVQKEKAKTCDQCIKTKLHCGDTGIDFYYLVVADGVKVEDTLYPKWGVISENGKIIRKAKRMKRVERDNSEHLINVSHVLVYKVFGNMYLGEAKA